VSYAYDDAGERSRLTYPDDRHADYTYTDDGQLATVSGPAGDTTSYTYDADGSEATAILPNGVVGSYGYDDAGRLSDLTWTKGAATLLALTYTRDANGDPTTITDSRRGDSTFSYDEVNQLTNETAGGHVTTYDYDPVGNRLAKTVDSATTSYSYDAGGEMSTAGSATYTYDANGARTARTGGTGDATYTYNLDGLLASQTDGAVTRSYVYDGENRRVAIIDDGTRTDFVLDTAVSPELVLQETTGATTTYTYGLGLISRETAAGIDYLLSDGLGSVRLATDASGDLVGEWAYDAFGNELTGADMGGDRFRYTGQWADAGGLTFLRARFYEPETGRFLSVDPRSGDISTPQTLDPYVYATNRPQTLTDPSGQISQEQRDVNTLQRNSNAANEWLDLNYGNVNPYLYGAETWTKGVVSEIVSGLLHLPPGTGEAVDLYRNRNVLSLGFGTFSAYNDLVCQYANGFPVDSGVGGGGASTYATIEPPEFHPYVIGKPFYYLGYK
jgi:RHS repeat-associated protein